MFSKEDKILILNEIKQHYKLKNNVEFASFLGISPQNLSNWYGRGTLDYELLYTKCLNINGDWLLSGKGEMFNNPDRYNNDILTCPRCADKDIIISLLTEKVDDLKAKITSLGKGSVDKNSNYSQTA